jgi:tetratricopeptide (TPR) repeat protein
VAAVAIATMGGGGRHATGSSVAARPPVTKAHKAPPRPVRHKPAPAKHTASTVTATPAAATTPAPVADTLEARGHQLMLNGDYSAAIPVLRQAAAAAPHSSLTYAYALYDLGRSLRLSGDPKDAVTVLYQRLQIPNQTETVREQLQLALQALGQQAGQSGGAGPAGAGPAGAAAGPAGAGDPAAAHHHHGGGPDSAGGAPTAGD